ncbi:hypothetical protein GGR53DRAFT_409596 [Hypoxylon sp. FL1150]|nr:hypothetical protein GGR53DRAFT_409596 [Hypoxylon sp. FL1150]
MRASFLLAVASAPLAALATPLPSIAALLARQGTPKFCERITPAPTLEETEARFNEFAYLFLVQKDIYRAFEYISPEYIVRLRDHSYARLRLANWKIFKNHNPAARNGAQNALNILGPVWRSQSITVLRTKFEGDMSWLDYRNSFREIVDRFRWKDGCIIEHWDQGERFPASNWFTGT